MSRNFTDFTDVLNASSSRDTVYILHLQKWDIMVFYSTKSNDLLPFREGVEK
jgi:hypothetical protein